MKRGRPTRRFKMTTYLERRSRKCSKHSNIDRIWHWSCNQIPRRYIIVVQRVRHGVPSSKTRLDACSKLAMPIRSSNADRKQGMSLYKTSRFFKTRFFISAILFSRINPRPIRSPASIFLISLISLHYMYYISLYTIFSNRLNCSLYLSLLTD